MPLTESEAQAVRDTISARLAAQWPYILGVQEAYLAAHGRYIQGLRTHSTIPADGEELPPDLTDTHPTDQPHTWTDVAQLPALMLSAMEIDTYDGPAGAGFVVRLLVRLNGALWALEQQHGPETWRAQAWHTVEG